MKKSVLFLLSLVFLSSIASAQFDPSKGILDQVGGQLEDAQNGTLDTDVFKEQELLLDNDGNVISSEPAEVESEIASEYVDPSYKEVEESQEFFNSASDPNLYDSTFKVFNISKNNADATISGAHLGDILLYDLELQGKSAGQASGISINLSQMLSSISIENMQNGELAGNNILYPNIDEQSNNWNRKYGLYVKVGNNDKNLDSLRSSFNGSYLTVPLLDKTEGCVSGSCDLAESGPAQNWAIWAMIIGVLGVFGLSVARR